MISANSYNFFPIILPMKNLFYSIFLTGFWMFAMVNQANAQILDKAPASSPFNLKVAGNQVTTGVTPPGNSINALWNIRFMHDVEELSNLISSAGIAFVNKQFIVSKWNGPDTISIFDSAGNFIQTRRILNAGAIRGMTYDGTFLYVGNNTNAVQVINPVNWTRVRQFTVPASVGVVRWISFNPTGNNGQGSFYVGDFNTAIFQINRPTGTSATLINSIPAATHGLSGIYGLVYDENGGNPLFWANVQNDPVGGAGSQCVIAQLNAQGQQTGVYRNVQTDVGAAGIAGGLFLGQVPGFPNPTLISLMQGQMVVGYDIAPLGFDAAVDSFNISNRMVAWPKEVNFTPSFGGRAKSLGNLVMNNVVAKVETRNLANNNLIESIPTTPFSLPVGGIRRFNSNPITANLYNPGTYLANGMTVFAGDENPGNDTLSAVFAITDSTMAKDYGYIFPASAGAVGVGGGAGSNVNQKVMGVKFNAPTATYVTSVSYFLRSPFAGQPSSASIYPIVDGTPSTTPLATTPGTYTAVTQDQTNGKLVTLAFAEPIYIPAGDFLVGVHELGDSTLRIGFNGQIYTPGNFYVKWATQQNGNWIDLGNFGANFMRALSIYPNFGLGFQQPADIAVTVNDTALCAGQPISVPFNPAASTTYVTGNEFRLEISNAVGEFTAPIVIGSLPGTAGGTINGTIPPGLVAGTGYKLRITASKPLRVSAPVDGPKIKALPITPVSIGGPVNFCPGDSNKQYIVAPIPGASGYVWTVPPGTTILSNPDSNAIFVHFGSTGGQVTVAGVNACGTGIPQTKNVSLTVVLPATATIFTPNTTVCQNAQVSFLSNTTNGGTGPQFQWMKNGEPIPGANASSYTTNSLQNNDVITMQLTSSNFCTTPNIAISNPLTMTVNPPQTPTAAITSDLNNNTACSGVNILFTSTVDNAGGTTPLYQWFKNNAVILGANQPTYAANNLVQGDVIKVRFRVTGSCLTTNEVFSNEITPTILPVGTVSYTVAQNTLTAVATDVQSYAWYLNGSIIPGANSQEYTITENGEYCVEVTFNNGCKNKSACQQQVFVGINDLLAKGEWVLVPNPAQSQVMAHWGNLPIEKIEIINSLGQRCMEIPVSGLQTREISIQHLKAGIYRIKAVEISGKARLQTLIKE